MIGPLRSGTSNWRQAATVILAAHWAHPGPAAPPLPTPPAEGFRLLLLQRSTRQGFMPGAHVFPGGVMDPADCSADWVRLFEPHHRPPLFGLAPSPPSRSAFPALPAEGTHAVEGALPNHVASRICAIRETFEEAGVLLLRPRASPAATPEPTRAFPPPPGLAAWRDLVRRDPSHFLRLCAHLDCLPDIWALHDWSGWLTPFQQRGGRRFNTDFFLCCLSEPPPIFPDLVEVVDCQVGRPRGAEWRDPGRQPGSTQDLGIRAVQPISD